MSDGGRFAPRRRMAAIRATIERASLEFLSADDDGADVRFKGRASRISSVTSTPLLCSDSEDGRSAKPTSAFDAEWGHFLITPVLFTKVDPRGRLTFPSITLRSPGSTGRGKRRAIQVELLATGRAAVERQREGIAKAKADGKYRGRAPTARRLADQVRELRMNGMPATQIAEQAEHWPRVDLSHPGR